MLVPILVPSFQQRLLPACYLGMDHLAARRRRHTRGRRRRARAAARAKARVERRGRGRRLRRRRRHRRRRLALRLVRERRDELLLEHRLLLDRGPDLRDLVRLLLPRLGLSGGAVRCAFPSQAGGGASRVAPRGPRRRARETRWGRGGERACASLKSSFTASMWPRERTQKADDRKIF